MFGVVKSLFVFVSGFHVFHVFFGVVSSLFEKHCCFGDVSEGDKLASVKWSLVGSCQ